ncbi:MAG: SusC/RagA family TonB-linked outer membrane protein [Cytophagales bacterium]|nr:SusC/RagA family TonB-linked outer membrane protein [Cytophagales bacterium]
MKKIYFSLIALLLLSGQVLAQRTVSGKVTDDSGEGLPGVNVVIKGTTTGVTSDLDGNYSISVPDENTVLVFSSVGMTTQEISVNSRTVIDLGMAIDVTELSEVVVTAIGIAREKKALGYNIETVDGEKVQLVSEPDPLRALQGKVSGVNISGSGGAPGSSTRITIRGNSSLLNNNQPLFVVDGVPYNNDFVDAANGVNSSLGGLTEGGSFGSRISDLDPNNIQSINILKSGAAAALYGSRAANGVVLITTKTGGAMVAKKGLEVTYSMSYAIEKIGNLPNYQNSYGTGTNFGYQQANGSWGAPFIGAQPYADVDSIAHWFTGRAGWSGLYDINVPYRAYPDNVEEFFQDGSVLENSITLRAGTANSVFTATLSRLEQEGFVPKSEFKRHNISVGGKGELENGLIIGASMAYTRSVQNGAITGVGNLGGSNPSPFTRSLLLGRNWDYAGQPFQNPTDLGSEFFVGRGTTNHPLWAVNNTGTKSNTDRYIASFNVGYDVLDWLNIGAKIGTNGYSTNVLEFMRPNGTVNPTGIINTNSVKQLEINGDLLLSVSKDLTEIISLDAHLGWNVNQRTSDAQRYQGTGYVVFDIDDIDNTNGVVPFGGIYSQRRLIGLYGDAVVGYKGWAYLSLAARNDWSSTLPEENRSFFYPAVTGSVIVTDAISFESTILSSLKVRGGWSQVGNDTGPYLTTDVFFVNNSFGLAPPNGPAAAKPFAGMPGASQNTIGRNPNLKPEISTEREIGFDVGLLQNKINLDVTYYIRKTVDQIISVPLPEETGFSGVVSNLGKVQNKGLEIGLNATPLSLQNGLEWNVGVAFTKNKNRIKRLGIGVNEIQFGSGFAGSVTAVHRPGKQYGLLLGSVDYRDDEGNLLVDPANGGLIPDLTRQIIGNPNPDFTVGITNTVSFKGVQLGAVFDWKQGGDLFSNTINQILSRGVLAFQADREVNRIIPGVYGDPTNGEPYLDESGNTIPNQTMIETNALYFGQTFAGNGSDEWLVWDATVFRLREVSLSYALPSQLLENVPFGSVLISLTGRNLWFSAPNFPKDTNFDPESNQFGGQRNNQGIEYSTVPTARRFAVNLKVSF